jgi:hypothetical protein
MTLFIAWTAGSATIIVWQIVCVAILRFFHLQLSFSIPFRIYTRRESDLASALKGRSKGNYVFICGFLFFTCPLFLGLITVDLLAHSQPYFDRDYYVGSAAVLALLAIAGVSAAGRVWRKTQQGIGSQFL